MKKSINHWAFPEGMELGKCFELAKAAGFEGIELNASEDGALPIDAGRRLLNRIAKLSQDHGLPISSICTGLLWKYPLTSNEAAIRAQGRRIVKRMLDIAAHLSVDTILVVPGVVAEDVSYDVAYKRAQEELGKLKDYARQVKVNIGVENVWNKFLLSPLEFCRFVDELRNAYIGVYFDVGNVLAFGYPQHWIKILNKRIKKIHLKDFQTNIGNITGFTYLLEGDVNWQAVIEALEAINYQDYLVAELPPYKQHPDLAIYHISAAMDRILGK